VALVFALRKKPRGPPVKYPGLFPPDPDGKPINHEKFFIGWCLFMGLCCLAMQAFK